MHLNDILDSKHDPTFHTLAEGPALNWAIDVTGSDDDIDPAEGFGEHHSGAMVDAEVFLDRLIDKSLEKVHQLQSAHRKDERRRVLVVSTLHRLLMRKMEILQEELLREEQSMMEDIPSERGTPSHPGSKQEAASILNSILQEKIGYLGFNRTVKIWVEPPKGPDQKATISVPQKGRRTGKQRLLSEGKPESGSPDETRNEAAPSEREPTVSA